MFKRFSTFLFSVMVMISSSYMAFAENIPGSDSDELQKLKARPLTPFEKVMGTLLILFILWRLNKRWILKLMEEKELYRYWDALIARLSTPKKIAIVTVTIIISIVQFVQLLLYIYFGVYVRFRGSLSLFGIIINIILALSVVGFYIFVVFLTKRSLQKYLKDNENIEDWVYGIIVLILFSTYVFIVLNIINGLIV